jgi:transposase
MMKPLELAPLSPAQVEELDSLYRTTKDVRLRTRSQIILLAAEQKMSAPTIAALVRETDQTVRNWLKRYEAEGIEGLKSKPQPGPPEKVTPAYKSRLIEVVRVRPRSLGQPYSVWTLVRLADYLAEQTGIRVEAETVRCHLKAADIVMSRPQHTISSPDPQYQVKKRRLKTPVGP